MEQSKDRTLAEVAAASGRAEAAARSADRAKSARDAAMVRAHDSGVSYEELQRATGLTRTGVYKALSSHVGGSLKDSTRRQEVG